MVMIELLFSLWWEKRIVWSVIQGIFNNNFCMNADKIIIRRFLFIIFNNIIIIIIIVISLCRVFIHIFPRQTMSIGNTVLQPFCRYYLWCLYLWFVPWLCCTFTLALFEVRVQCPIWLFSVVPSLHGFLVCCLCIL